MRVLTCKKHIQNDATGPDVRRAAVIPSIVQHLRGDVVGRAATNSFEFKQREKHLLLQHRVSQVSVSE